MSNTITQSTLECYDLAEYLDADIFVALEEHDVISCVARSSDGARAYDSRRVSYIDDCEPIMLDLIPDCALNIWKEMRFYPVRVNVADQFEAYHSVEYSITSVQVLPGGLLRVRLEWGV